MGLFKKALLGGLIAGGTVVAIKGTQMGGHVRHEVREARKWAEDRIPMEKQFQVLREEIAQLDGELDRVKTDLAREIVDVRALTDSNARLRAKVDGDRKAILAKGKEIKEATVKVKYGASEMSVEQATARLAKDAAALKADVSRLALNEATLAKREEIKETLQKTLEAMAGKKQEMLAEVNAAEADYKVLQLAQVKSKYQTDDTKLAKVKERLAAIKRKNEIARAKLDLEPIGRDETPLTAAGQAATVDEILAPLAGEPAKGGAKGE